MSLLLLYVLIVSLIFISHAFLFSLSGLSSIVSLFSGTFVLLLLILFQGSHLIVEKCSTLKSSSCTFQFSLNCSYLLPRTTHYLPSELYPRQATDGQAIFPLTTPFSDLNAYINNVASIHPSLFDPLLLLPSLPKLKKSRKHKVTPKHKRTLPSLSTVRFNTPFTCVTQRRFLLFSSFRR